ncbi:hypothetical protein LJB42_002733 [Komagataella kurtzmanii]|nr:hypothetical protein LJB42_002733 [Komagataella kurtzmanii]
MSADEFATKAEVEEIFKRLKKRPANQQCNDCQASNPSWTSIPFGIFVCLECSGEHRNVGVHISFVKSSVLDANWTYRELRSMKNGGNDLFKEFYNKNGGGSLLTTGVKQKYDNPIAVNYKKKLAQKVEKDFAKFPDVLDGTGSDNSTPEPTDHHEDFFSSWSKPAVNSSTSSLNAISSRSGTPQLPQNSAPKRTTVKTTTTSGPKKNILGGSSTRSRARLGAKKLSAKEANFDFDDFEKQAREEEEAVKKLGYNPADSSIESASTATNSIAAPVESSKTQDAFVLEPSYSNASTASVKKTTQQFAKLGFGMTASSSNPEPSVEKASRPARHGALNDDTPGEISQKFSGQKAISSDQVFGRSNYGEDSNARSKLQTEFNGATAISSSSYFGQPDPKPAPSRGLTASNLEEKVYDVFGDDINQLKDVLETGAEKFSSYLRDYLRN